MNQTPRFIAVFLLTALAGLFVHLHGDTVVPLNRSFTLFPTQVADWRMISQTAFNDKLLGVLKPTDYLSRRYQSATGEPVELYVGYHGGGKNGGEIHSPKHCLPGSGWFEVASKTVRIAVGGTVVHAVQAVYQLGERRELFIYWFQVRDRTITSEYALKVAEVINSLLYRRRDASFIRISLPARMEPDDAIAAGERFVRDFYPVLREFLPK